MPFALRGEAEVDEFACFTLCVLILAKQQVNKVREEVVSCQLLLGCFCLLLLGRWSSLAGGYFV